MVLRTGYQGCLKVSSIMGELGLLMILQVMKLYRVHYGQCSHGSTISCVNAFLTQGKVYIQYSKELTI